MKKVILGTDWWTDCDDAVALRVISKFVKAGKAELIGIGINACMEYSAASVMGFLKAEELNGIPLGIDLTAVNFGGTPRYQKNLAEKYCPAVKNEDVPDAVRLYRRLLAESNEKVEILEIGFLQVFVGVLKSGADDISEKTGLELVRDKVSKVWVMAGKWDADGEKEHNFCLNTRTRAAGKEFCELCPVPVTFLGWEIGFDVITGDKLDQNDHLYRVMFDHGSKNGRSSWDPMLVLMALVGDEREAGYGTVTGIASVDAETGENYFEKRPDGKHKYVVKLYENDYYKNKINEIL